jgi:regulator of replication initiation timing
MSNPASEPAQKGNKAGIVIGLLSIIVIIQSVKIFMDYRAKGELNQQLETTTEDLTGTRQRMVEISAELDQKISEIQKLGGEVDDLKKAKAEIETQLKRNVSWSSKAIKELKDRVAGYEELLKIKDTEIEQLKSVNTSLFSENRNLKTELNTQKSKLSDSISTLSKNKDELATKVAIASQLKAENIKVVALSEKGKEREAPFRSRQVEKLKVDFNLADNKVAPIEGKKIYVRILDENGQAIFDMARGSGSFIINGKEEWFTAVQEILFDNTRQKLSFIYEKGSEYPAGNYQVEIIADGYKLGSVPFTVK